MSETQQPPPPASTNVTVGPLAGPVGWHSLLEPQFLISAMLVVLAYIIYISAIRYGSAELQAQVLSQGNNIIAGLMGFFFGAAITKVGLTTTQGPKT